MLQTFSLAASHWRLARWRQRLLPKIHAQQAGLAGQDEAALCKRSLALRFRAKSGEAMIGLVPEAFALVREAARRTVGMQHFDVQLLGGMALFDGAIAEMETGEGKTLTATLPLYLRALRGKGALLATVNDYLAHRDAEWMRPVFEVLGLSAGVIQTQMPPDHRRKAYACDITYGTAKEFGFDFLRDRLLLREMSDGEARWPIKGVGDLGKRSGEQPVQRSAYFALVDEADSVLIDDARTPLVISSLPGAAEASVVGGFVWGAQVAGQFVEQKHYEYQHEQKSVELNSAGRQLVRGLPKPPILDQVGQMSLYDFVERAIKVEREFHRDRQYVVCNGEVVIVDESTGRLAEGRKWRDGIHQAVEAREGVKVTVDTGQAARITVQDFFLRFRHLAGMTGTAASSASEFRKVYHLYVVRIPTNRPARRRRMPDRVFARGGDKWQAIVEEVVEVHRTGRPVLVGTRSIEHSQHLAQLLTAAGVEHQVLNAHHVEAEAAIVACAGQPGRVTVSTNMAGRGTDIRLLAEVADLGGLHVICSELHDSARIDRQLAGRCGRQGDPGTVRQFLALDDDVLPAGLGPRKARRLRERADRLAGSAAAGRGARRLSRLFRSAQRRVEAKHFRGRKMLLYYEKQRRKMQAEVGLDPYLDTPD